MVVDAANADKPEPEKVQGMSDTLARFVDNTTDFVFSEATFIVKKEFFSVATIFIPTAFNSRFKPFKIREGADTRRWHTAGCVGTCPVYSADESGRIVVEVDQKDKAADDSME